MINRLGTNSFLVKSWSVTLISALFVLAAAQTDVAFVYVTCFPAFAFWLLDAYFLRQEKLFRGLHDHVRRLAEIDFSMDTSQTKDKVGAVVIVAFSRTLILFHGTIAIAIAVVWICLK